MAVKSANIYLHKPDLKITTHNHENMTALTDEEHNAEIDVFDIKKS